MYESKRSRRGVRVRARRAPLGVSALFVLLVGLIGLAGAGSAAAATAAGDAAAGKRTGASVTGVVNVNTASSEELQLLPGVGKVRAGAILETRKERGGFKSVDDLKAVSGIGDSMLDRMRPHLTLKGRTTARRAGSSGGDDRGSR